MNTLTVVKHSSTIVVATLVAGDVCCEMFHPGLEPNPHVDQELNEPGFTVRATASVSGSNVAAHSVSFGNAFACVPGNNNRPVYSLAVPIEWRK